MVFCYRNLNRKGVVWSVRSKKTGLVVARLPVVVLKNVELKVSQAGRKRVLRAKRKNVHAGAQGTWLRGVKEIIGMNLVPIKYNPYKMKSFRTKTSDLPVLSAKYVILRHDGAWAAL
jgi:hypothetical protein